MRDDGWAGLDSSGPAAGTVGCTICPRNPNALHTPLWTPFTLANQKVMSLIPASDSAMDDAAVISEQHHCRFCNAVTPQPRF